MTLPLVILLVLGIILFVHSICTVNLMPPDETPMLYGLSAALMCGCSIGTSAFAFYESPREASMLCVAAVLLKIVMVGGAKLSGFPVKGITIFHYEKRPLTPKESRDSGWHVLYDSHLGGGHGNH